MAPNCCRIDLVRDLVGVGPRVDRHSVPLTMRRAPRSDGAPRYDIQRLSSIPRIAGWSRGAVIRRGGAESSGGHHVPPSLGRWRSAQVASRIWRLPIRPPWLVCRRSRARLGEQRSSRRAAPAARGLSAAVSTLRDLAFRICAAHAGVARAARSARRPRPKPWVFRTARLRWKVGRSRDPEPRSSDPANLSRRGTRTVALTSMFLRWT